VNGIVLVDKPEGVTSAGVIRALKPRLGGAKVGHLGTLDPFASGLLPLCVGEATKIARYLLVERKAYTGTIRLGVATDTLDRTGRVTETAPVPAVDAAQLAAVARRFHGVQHQVPPMYSALKRGGVPLYELARRGVEVERRPRAVEVFALGLAPGAPERIELAVECSKGTYVRVLAAEIGRALGTVAHLERLRRTAVGAFRVEDALPLHALAAGAVPPLVSVRRALAGLPAHPASPRSLARLRCGQQDVLSELPAPGGAGETALVVDAAGEVAAIVEAVGTRPVWRLVRLLASPRA
jgi:tRNA pseudouridine55 synthase